MKITIACRYVSEAITSSQVVRLIKTSQLYSRDRDYNQIYILLFLLCIHDVIEFIDLHQVV